MSRARTIAFTLWFLLLALSGLLVVRARYSTDLSAFLPRSPSPMQQLLVQQLQEGPASRLILIGIDGGDAATRARLSHAVLSELRQRAEFSMVANGELAGNERDREFAYAHRYLLSDAITPQHFSTQGLHTAIADSIDLMASPAGLLTASLFQTDPTGETLQVIDQFDSLAQPQRVAGAWSSRDGRRALLIAQTRANGSDTDAQAHAATLIRAAFERAAAPFQGRDPRSPLALRLSGPGVLSVDARATIKHEAVRLSLLSTALIVALLLSVYRSVPVLLFGLLPVVSGALAGVAAVALGFGVVFGITLGFGITLIGESVDYPIYFFIQSRGLGALLPASSAQPLASSAPAGDTTPEHARQLRRLWSIIGLGALTSICGFASLLPSAFPGLAQLGLYSISGLIVAAAVTRFALPALLPRSLRIADLAPLGTRVQRLLARYGLPRTAAVLLACLCAGVLYQHRDRLWNRDLAALSPVPAASQALDAQMRTDLGAPDVSNLVIVSAPSEQAALQRAERAGRRLDALIAGHVIGGYDSPARYLPSQPTQEARLESLPDSPQMQARLAAAIVGLPVSSARLEPFVQQVEAARRAGPITRAALEGTSLALAVDSLLWHQAGQWCALLPLHAPAGAGAPPAAAPAAPAAPTASVNTTNGAGRDIDIARVRAALADLAPDGVLVFNLKQESDRLYSGYLAAAIRQSLTGFAAILLLLAIALRSARRVGRVLAPLLLAVLAVSATFALTGHALTIMHLIGMLLIVAVGSNYALFFDRSAADSDRSGLPRTLASLIVANASTVAAFGVLACSTVPVLNALGRTVAPGTLLVLLFAALLAPRTLFRASQPAPPPAA